jgi:hypothetical protein
VIVMSWLPSFISPLAGAIAAGLSISALLVLYFLKLRRREMPVSSTILWRKAVQDLQVNAPFQKLRKNLLLLLQLLVLLALCLALSRPVINAKQGAGKLTVILIDRSASMAAKDVDGAKRTRLEEAKRLALEVVDSMSREDNACVIAFDDAAVTLCPLSPDTAKLRLAINSVEQTDRRSKLKLAYQLADAQSAFIPEQNRANVRPRVFLFSDGRAADAESLTLHGDLKFEPIGSTQTGNIAIVAFSAKRNYENPTEVQIFARLANFGSEPVDADVNLSVATDFTSGPPTFQLNRTERVKLVPERWTDKERDDATKKGVIHADSVAFKLALATAGVIRVEQMNKEGDALSADDMAQVVVPPPKSLSVLLVTDNNPFLERFKTTMQLKDFDVLNPIGYEDAKPAKYDVVIYDRYDPKFLPQTGNFLYFRAVPPAGRIKRAMQGIKPLYNADSSILDWKRDHPILRDINLGKLGMIGPSMKLDLPPVGVERLIEGSRGPLAVIAREGRSTHLVVAFDVLESVWPLRMSFPVFFYQALQYLALGSEMDVRESFAPGATPSIPLGDLRRVAGDRQQLRINGPMGSKDVKIPDAGDFVLPALDRVGLYTFPDLPEPIPGHDKLAVNLLDANESNLVPLVGAAPGNVGEVQVSTGKSRVELWWWLSALAVPLLLIEWFVYTRRVHL